MDSDEDLIEESDDRDSSFYTHTEEEDSSPVETNDFLLCVDPSSGRHY